ncbi:MAG: sugar phosphate isomerase/epimerase [Phycisphaerae bacterium]|nr:sugar phosphate isomerase/epimerase [Phycisphaerae bacterium]
MIRPAFSTVACPDWTIRQAIEAAELFGYTGIEFRTLGSGSGAWACEPFLTDPGKQRRMLERAGVEACCLATSIRFDGRASPPIIGEAFFDRDKPIRATREAVALAADVGSPFVRVFAFEVKPRETRARAAKRIGEGLTMALAMARHSGVRLALENGGSFGTAADLIELIDAQRNSLLVASYDASAAMLAGEDPCQGVRRLGDRLRLVRLRDFKDGKPCPLGEGDLRASDVLRTLHDMRFDGWAVYEYDRAWLPAEVRAGLPTTAQMLSVAAARMYELIGRHSGHDPGPVGHAVMA